MILFLWNLILAIFWVALTNSVSALNFALGFALGYVVLFLARDTWGQSKYFRKSGLWVSFVFFFIMELVKSALRVALDVVTRRHRMHPGVISIPLDCETDLEIMLFANLVSLTPGSLSLDVSEDRKFLYIHAMYIDQGDIQAYQKRLKVNVETKLLEILR